jgi:peptidoglycan hydrolase-like protein with peptidoglycan-binding domain
LFFGERAGPSPGPLHFGDLIGEIDGKAGLETRSAVKQVQMKAGIPAVSYPTPEAVELLRRWSFAQHICNAKPLF